MQSRFQTLRGPLALALTLQFTCGTAAFARIQHEDSEGQAYSLNPKEVRTVAYLGTESKALVGVVQDNGIGTFLICQVPAAANPVRALRAEFLSECRQIPQTNYLADEETVQKINKNFLFYFESAYKRNMKIEAENARAPFMSAGLGTVALALGGNFYVSGVRQIRTVKGAGYLRGAGNLALGGVLLAGSLVSIGVAGYSFYDAVKPVEILPMEQAVLDAVQKMNLAQQKGYSTQEIEQIAFVVTQVRFKSLIEALQNSISEVNRL